MAHDRLHKIETHFDDDGENPPTIRRELKVITEGGIPVEREIDAGERTALYGQAFDASRAAIADALNARDAAVTAQAAAVAERADAVAARDAAVAALTAMTAQRDALAAELDALSPP